MVKSIPTPSSEDAVMNSGLKARKLLRFWAEVQTRPNLSFENTLPLRAGFPNGGGMKDRKSNGPFVSMILPDF